MKIEELRIGNKIIVTSMDFDGNEIIDIATINTLSKGGGVTLDFEDEDEMQMFTHLEDCKPIPLTEEWLLKFGFEVYNVSNSSFTHRRKGKFCIWSYGDDTYFQFKTSDDIDDVKIKHVHQLQNLYFALTGEELKIKENK